MDERNERRTSGKNAVRILSNDQAHQASRWRDLGGSIADADVGGYLVNTLAATCTCPDHETRRCKCKHHVGRRDSSSTHRDCGRRLPGRHRVRQGHPQDLLAGLGRTTTTRSARRKSTVQDLLRGLCDGIQSPAHAGRGPKPLPLSDAVYANGHEGLHDDVAAAARPRTSRLAPKPAT